LDINTCRKKWSSIRLAQPDWFPNFAKLCRKLGRQDLAEFAAQQILSKAEPAEFRGGAVNIRVLSFILHFTRSCGLEIQLSFLDHCISNEWLDQQFLSPETQLHSLAGDITSLAGHPNPEIRRYFTRPSLLARFLRHKPGGRALPGHVASWLQLLGAIRLLGLETSALPEAQISQETIQQALALFPPNAVPARIQSIQSSLWMGLHEWYFLKGDACSVDPTLGEGILADFAATESDNPRYIALNAAMIAWLSEGRERGWALPTPVRSLADVVGYSEPVLTA
jgi:hypothetical protein